MRLLCQFLSQYLMEWLKEKGYSSDVMSKFRELLLVRVEQQNRLEERGRLGIMAGTYPGIPNRVIVLSVNNNSIQETYTAHAATFSDKEERFSGRCLFHLATIEERIPLKHHPQYAGLQRATDGWAWFTSNVGQLLPHFNDIEVDEQEEPLPAIGEVKYYTWTEVTGELLSTSTRKRRTNRDASFSSALKYGCGFTLHWKIEGSLSLPEPVAGDVQRYADEQEKSLYMTLITIIVNNQPKCWKKRPLLQPLGGTFQYSCSWSRENWDRWSCGCRTPHMKKKKLKK